MNDILNQDIVQNVEEYEVDHNKVEFIDDNRKGQTFFETQDLLPHGRETYFLIIKILLGQLLPDPC